MKSNNYQSSFVFILLFLFFSNPIHAAHIVGGEMTYRCLGGGDYEITLRVFRDCQAGGAAFDGPGNGRISIYNGNSQTEFAKITMPDPLVSVVDFPPINNCLTFPPNICVEEGTYVMKLSNQGIFLPSSTESYFIVYQRCCRSNTLTNINDPQETGATYFVEIKENAQTVCNNAPAFANIPPLKVCVGEHLAYTNLVTEPDGDSLVFALCTPLQGGGTAGWLTPGNSNDFDGTNPNPDAPPPYAGVGYFNPFTASDPISSDPAIAIDSNSGLLTGTPNLIGEFVIGICVKEYRNGILLSETRRDVHFNALPCIDPLVVDYSHTGLEANYQFDNLSINANSYSWDFGDGNFSDEENPSHVFAQAGTYTVELTGYNANCDLTEFLTKEIVVIITDVETLENQFKVSILPNPNSGDFLLDFESISNQTVEIEIFDLNGRAVLEDVFSISSGQSSKSMNVSHFSKGIYCLMVKSNNGIKVEKLVIQ